MTGACTAAMLLALLQYTQGRGPVIVIPSSALEGYSRAQIEQGLRCCKERRIVCRIVEDRP